MFRRRTDDAICARLGKRSLDVGADKIARTAHAALTLLDELRRSLEIPIELAWNPNSLGRVAAIEVYPAATRLAHGVAAGVDWITRLPDRVVTTIDPLPESLDAQDAIVCVLAGFDFLRGKAVGPTFLESEKARSEGWIWARAR